MLSIVRTDVKVHTRLGEICDAKEAWGMRVYASQYITLLLPLHLPRKTLFSQNVSQKTLLPGQAQSKVRQKRIIPVALPLG